MLNSIRCFIIIVLLINNQTVFSQNKQKMEKNKEPVCNPNDTTCNISNRNVSKEKIKVVQTSLKPKLVYYYDALCGWCFGFSLVMEKIKKEYQDKLDIEVVSGGLFIGERIGTINKVAPYIKQGAYKLVEQRTGVYFGKDFLNILLGDGNMFLNSLYPSIALCIVKDQMPNKQFEFAEILLAAFYKDGLSSDKIDDYLKYVDKIGLDRKSFKKDMNLFKYQEAAYKEFERFQKSQLNGMPSLVIEKEGESELLCSGYLDFSVLSSKIDEKLK